MDNRVLVRLLIAAGVLMLLAGIIFVFLKLWLYATLLAVGAFGCLIGALNFKNKKDEDSK